MPDDSPTIELKNMNQDEEQAVIDALDGVVKREVINCAR